jgi:hypothetical protein
VSRPTFVEKSLFGTAIYQITGMELEIVSHYFGQRERLMLPLRTLDPACTRTTRVLLAMMVLPLLVGLISVTAVWWLMQQEAFPRILSIAPAMFAALGFGTALHLSRPFTYYEFSDQWRRSRFRIWRERHQAAECDAFVAELSLRIHAAQGELTAEEVGTILATGPYATLEKHPPTKRAWRGQAALLCGILSNLVLLLPGATATNGAFLLLFPLLCAGLLLGSLSLEAKERPRLWSVLGIGFSLLPLLGVLLS